MAAKSKHHFDVNVWILKVINSCITMEQIMSAKKLIALYANKYPYKKPYGIRWRLQERLEREANSKLEKIMKNVEKV
jgi:hypothetical protein